ncbi:hypothetical protein BFJ69_g6681 [Fusarium oxysporum]|uniref:Uncharacterized protein n=1 Tax=Fusarium oxysporum TaxID=5507 RepID=A0A420N8Z7_FUSOX|nr:hypothetical protein BFJ69_g6681 [Fusarium oxysporum]
MKFITIIAACSTCLVSARYIQIRDELGSCHNRTDARRDARAAGCTNVSNYDISGTLCNPSGCDCDWGCIESDGVYDTWRSHKCPNRVGSDVCSED